MASTKAKREFRVADSSRRLAEHTVGGAHLRIPKGIPLFDPKKGVAYDVDFIAYELSKKALEYKKNYAEPGDYYVERTYHMHYNIGPDRDKVVCLARTFGRPCPVCEYRNQLAEDPKSKEVKALYAKERQLWLVYVHQEKEKGLQLWDISNWCFGKNRDAKINNATPKKKPAYLNHYHPTEGLTLRITNEEKAADDRGAKFLEFFVDEFQERDDELTEKIVKMTQEAPCLDEIPNAMSYKELKKLFLQIDKADEEENRNGDGHAKSQDDDDPDDVTDDDNETGKEEEKEAEEEGENEHENVTVEWKKGMKVSFMKKGKEVTGTILKVDTENDIARVEDENEAVHIVDLDELTEVEEEEASKTTGKGGKPSGRPRQR